MTSPGPRRPVPVDRECGCEAERHGLKAPKAEEVACHGDHTQSDTGGQVLRAAWRTGSGLAKEGRWSAKSWSQDSRNGSSGSCSRQTKRGLGGDRAEQYRGELRRAELSGCHSIQPREESRPAQVSTVALDLPLVHKGQVKGVNRAALRFRATDLAFSPRGPEQGKGQAELASVTSSHVRNPSSLPQVWFQNRRARHPGQSRSGPANDRAANQEASPQLTVPGDPGPLPGVPGCSELLAPSNPLGSTQASAAATLPVLSMGFAPLLSCGGPGSQALGATTAPPTQAWQGGSNSPTPEAMRSHSLMAPTLGGCLSARHAHLYPLTQGKCQRQQEHPDMAPLPFQGYPLPPEDNPCQPVQEAGPLGSPYAPQWFGEGSRPVVSTGQAPDGAAGQPAHAETPGWRWQAPPTARLSRALAPQHPSSAEASSFLEELLSSTEREEDTQPFPSGHLGQEEPPGPLEAPLSEDEFQALLAMLHDSTWPQS